MKPKNKGGILIYMLGMITLLSIVVTEFLLETASAIRFRSQMGGRQDLEIVAYSALETSLGVLEELKLLDKGLFAPVQGWGDPLKYIKFPVPEGYTVKVSIHDETGKLSIYESDLTNFGNLLVEMGFSYEIVLNLKGELKKYLDKLNKAASSTSARNSSSGSESSQTRSEARNPSGASSESSASTSPSSNANASGRNNNSQKAGNEKKTRTLFNLEQLKEIPRFERTFFDAKGNPNEQFKLLKQNVSVLNTGKVNINTAPELVKKLLIGTLKPNLAGKKYLTSMKDLGIGGNRAQGNETEEAGNQREGNETGNQDQERQERFGFKASIFDIEIEVSRGPIKYHLGVIAEDNKPKSGNENRNTSEQSRNGENPRNGRDTSSGTATTEGSRNASAGRNTSGAQNGSSRSESQTKENFSFLALTEDDSFIN